MILFCRFRAGIKDLEVMMQNVITTAFETVTTVEQGVELLDAFQHLSSREVNSLFLSQVDNETLLPVVKYDDLISRIAQIL